MIISIVVCSAEYNLCISQLNMKKTTQPYLFYYLFCFIFLLPIDKEAMAQGYEIQVQLDNYKHQEIYLATFEGGQPHYRDTATLTADSLFIFKGDSPLDEGIYLILIQPRKQALQLLVDESNQQIQLSATAANLTAQYVTFENADINSQYYEYLRYDRKNRQEFNDIFQKQKTAERKAYYRLQKKLTTLSEEIYAHQEKLIRQYTGTLLELLIRLDHEPLMPKWKGSEEEQRQQGLRFRQQHFFDGVPMTDERIVNSPLFYNKINFYISKLHPQEPDSIIQTIGKVFQLLRPAPNNYSYVMQYLLRKYQHPRIAGQDAVFVKLVDQYIQSDSVPGITKDDRISWISNANKLRPVLIGKTAPDITMQQRNGQAFRLHDIQADFTVLIFWRPNCGHCKKATPVLKELYQKYKDKNVQMVGLCTQHGDGIESCWEYVDNNELQWLQLVDRFHRSKFMQKFNAQRTPKIYILDKDKKILMKDIDAKHIDKVLQRFMEEGT